MATRVISPVKNWRRVLCLLIATILLSTPGAVSSDDDPECHDAHCADVGEKCTGDFTQNAAVWSAPLPLSALPASLSCGGGSHERCCGVGLKCWNGRCAANNFGTACSTSTPNDQQCFDVSFEASYPTAMCLYGNCRATQLPGDRCSESAECIGATQCVASACTSLPLGHRCSYSSECAFNSYCDASTAVCTASLPAGSSCTSNAECADNNRCHPASKDATTSVCLAPFSQQVGDFCEPEKNPFHFMCESGLECTLNHTCAVPQPGSSLGDSCSLDTDEDDDDLCISPSTCECNQFVGEFQCSGYYSPAAPAADKLQLLHSCLIDHQCKSAERWFSGTCASTHCSTEYQAAMDGVCPQLSNVLGKCAHVPLYSDCVYSDEDDGDELTELDIAGLVFAMLCAVVLLAVLSILLHRFYIRHRAASASAASSLVYTVLQTELDSPNNW